MIVLFDLDGTVWDSEPGIVGSLEHTFGALGMAVPDREVLAANLGPPLQLMLAELGVPDERNEEATVHYRDRYVEWGASQARVYRGIEELLDALTSAGHRLATATSKGEGPTRQMLAHFGLIDRFEVVGAATMDASAATKPLVIARALEALGGPDPAGCVMVGDRSYDVRGAAEHGISTIGVTWGYGNEAELLGAGAAHLATRPEDVVRLVDDLATD